MRLKNQTRAVKEGDHSAFRDFVSVSTDRGYFLALKILGDPDEARDVLQDAYVKLWDKRKTLQEDKAMWPWLSKVIVNHCYDRLKRRQKMQVVSAMEGGEAALWVQQAPNLEQEMDTREMASVLQEMIAYLPPKQKVVFVLSELEGLSNPEIHQTTGISLNSVKTNLMIARKKVMERVKKYYAEIP